MHIEGLVDVARKRKGQERQPAPSSGSAPNKSVIPSWRQSSVPFVAVTGYLIGVLSLYTSYFTSIWKVTAVLIDMLTLVALVSLGTSLFRDRGRLDRRVTAGAIVVVLALLATLVAFHPPNLRHPEESGETCVYNVRAGVSVPIVKNGSIAQEFFADAHSVSSVSVIVGLDSALADPSKKHPVELTMKSATIQLDQRLELGDVVNNAFTRFNLPEPRDIGDSDPPITIEVFNRSEETIGIYVKEPDRSDHINTQMRGALITGHLHQEPTYSFDNHMLSGCVTGL
jgi:hypothetical protein